MVPGGRSKETLLVSLSGTTELPTEVIVRKDRPIGLLATKASDEFAILRAVHDHGGVPVARPLFADDSDRRRGTLLVMERVRGEKAGEYFPDLAMPPEEYRHAIGTQLATALAHLHAVPLDTLAGTGLDLDASGQRGIPFGCRATAWPAGSASSAGRPLPPSLWRANGCSTTSTTSSLPVRCPSCRATSDCTTRSSRATRVTALVDWEAATIGPPARELAAAWPAATALMEWPAFVAAYRAAGGSSEATDEWAVTYLPGLLRARCLHVEPDGRPPLPHR